MRILDAAAEAPGGAGYELPAQNRILTPERRDP